MPVELCIELADEGGTQDPDRPSGWWDVQALESQYAQVIVPEGILARSRKFALLPATRPLPTTGVKHLYSVYGSPLLHAPRAVFTHLKSQPSWGRQAMQYVSGKRCVYSLFTGLLSF